MLQTSQQNEIIEKFSHIKKRQMMALIPVGFAIAMFLLASRGIEIPFVNLQSTLIGPVGFAIIVGVLIFSLVNWRCPACEGYLGKGMSHKFCPKCGAQLEA